MNTRKNRRWEEMDKGNMELRELAKHFEAFNCSDNKSPHTVEWYNDVLELFLRWLESEKRSTKLGDVGEAEARAFILHLRGKTYRGKSLSSHTLANRARALRGFFSWLARDGYTDGHLLSNFKPPKTTKTIVEPLTPEEIGCLFSRMNQNTALGARSGAMLALFLDTGLRLSELAGLKETDAHLVERYVKVMGKGGKERIVPLGNSCQKALMHYYHHFRGRPAHAGVDTFFLNLDGYPMSPLAIRSLVVRLANASGVTRLHPHLLRHTYATNFLLNGGDVFMLKQNLGHSTLVMVEHYLHIASREAAVLSETFSPLDRMNLKELRRHRSTNNRPGHEAAHPSASPRPGPNRMGGYPTSTIQGRGFNNPGRR